MPRVVLLGATSAIAAEVAVLYARRGDRLHLVGRSADKLRAVAARCEALGAARITTARADFTNRDECSQVVARAREALGEIDTALVAHGDLGDQLASEQSADLAAATFEVNLLSVVNLLIPLANAMEPRRGGRIGVITSVAGDRGRPRNYTYGAAKGALHIYLQGLRSRLYASGVTVTTLKVGPVDTPMTRDHTKNMLFAQPGAVAEAIVRAMDARTTEAYIPSYWRWIMAVVKHTPEPVFQRLAFLSGR